MLVTDRITALVARFGILRRPEEACGLIFADGTVVELENCTDLDRSCNYRLGTLPSVMRQLREQRVTDEMFEGRYMVWHTHPSGFVGPSDEDLRHRVKGVDYLVVSLTDDGPIAVRF